MSTKIARQPTSVMIDDQFDPCAVIPVFNHERTIAVVVDTVLEQGLPVLLIDDGSHAACATELNRLSALAGVTLLRHEENRGKGAAVCTGLRAAYECGYSHALQIDADGQHVLSDVRRFIEEARVFPAGLICGRPIFDDSIPGARLYGRYISHVFVWLETLSLDIVDSMCGFRVYPLRETVALLRSANVRSRMDFDTEILVRLHWRGVPMRWLDTGVRYPSDGVSHFRMIHDNVLMVTLHIQLLAGMLLRLPLLLTRKLARRDGRKLETRKHHVDAYKNETDSG